MSASIRRSSDSNNIEIMGKSKLVYRRFIDVAISWGGSSKSVLDEFHRPRSPVRAEEASPLRDKAHNRKATVVNVFQVV